MKTSVKENDLHWGQKAIIRVGLCSDFTYLCGMDDYILTLPKTEEELREVRERLGVKDFGECETVWMDSPLQSLLEVPYGGDVALMNSFAKASIQAIEKGSQSTLLLLAALEAFQSEDAYELEEQIEHLDCYELFPDEYCTPEAYGRFWFYHSPAANYIDVDKMLLPYIDFAAYGQRMMEQNDVIVTDLGWISPKIQECKLYLPLEAYLEYAYEEHELDAGDMVSYRQPISECLEADREKHLTPAGFIAESKQPEPVKNKVISVIPAVEEVNGELWGCLKIVKQGWIAEKDWAALCDEWEEQLKNGWGRQFAKQPIPCAQGTLHVYFDNSYDEFRFFSAREVAEMNWQTDCPQIGPGPLQV